MVEDTILQHWVFTRFVLPFLVVFFIVFAILEKTKIFGDGKKQLNALISFVIGLIFVGVAYPVLVINNLILFLVVALIIVFVIMILWGFVFSGEKGFEPERWMKVILAIVIILAVIVAVLWATGIENNVFDWLFFQNWSGDFWINAIFIVLIAVALALMLKSSKKD